MPVRATWLLEEVPGCEGSERRAAGQGPNGSGSGRLIPPPVLELYSAPGYLKKGSWQPLITP